MTARAAPPPKKVSKSEKHQNDSERPSHMPVAEMLPTLTQKNKLSGSTHERFEAKKVEQEGHSKRFRTFIRGMPSRQFGQAAIVVT